MKKFTLLIFSLMLFISTFSFNVSAMQEVSLFLNNETVEMVSPPVFKNQRTMVTLDSDFFTKAGAVTKFDKETETITLDGYIQLWNLQSEKSASVYRKYDLRDTRNS